MKAWASLHTKNPASQSDGEVAYKGYSRVAVDWNADFGRRDPVIIRFERLVEDYSDLAATHVTIGVNETGDGEIMQTVELIPNVPLKTSVQPAVVFANIPEPLPAGISITASIAWHLVNARELDPATLHPLLFEAINKELHEHGVPVIKVTRSATAAWNVKMSNLPSLSDFATQGSA